MLMRKMRIKYTIKILVQCFVYLYIMDRLLTFKSSMLSGNLDIRQTDRERERESNRRLHKTAYLGVPSTVFFVRH